MNAVTAGVNIIYQKLIPQFVGLCCPSGNAPQSKKEIFYNFISGKLLWPNASMNNLWQFSVQVQVSFQSQKPF